MTDDNETAAAVAPVRDASPLTAGGQPSPQNPAASRPIERRWGFLNGITFIPLPKMPMQLEDADRVPPFVVTLPSGATRQVIYEPED